MELLKVCRIVIRHGERRHHSRLNGVRVVNAVDLLLWETWARPKAVTYLFGVLPSRLPVDNVLIQLSIRKIYTVEDPLIVVILPVPARCALGGLLIGGLLHLGAGMFRRLKAGLWWPSLLRFRNGFPTCTPLLHNPRQRLAGRRGWHGYEQRLQPTKSVSQHNKKVPIENCKVRLVQNGYGLL